MTLSLPRPVWAARRWHSTLRSGAALRRLRPPPPVSRALGWLGLALLGAVVALLVFFALAPRLLGWQFVIVAGGSMEPTIRFGSLAVMAPVDRDSLQLGDIVRYRDPTRPGRVVTHRIVAVSEDRTTFTTRGDANNVDDPSPVALENVEAGYLFSVPKAGSFARWVGTRAGYMTMVLVPGLVIIAWESASIVRTVRDARRQPGEYTTDPTAG